MLGIIRELRRWERGGGQSAAPCPSPPQKPQVRRGGFRRLALSRHGPHYAELLPRRRGTGIAGAVHRGEPRHSPQPCTGWNSVQAKPCDWDRFGLPGWPARGTHFAVRPRLRSKHQRGLCPPCCIMTASGDSEAHWNAVRSRGKAEMDRDDAERIVTELFTSCYSATVRYAAHRCGSLDLAEDLVQEAFGALYARLRAGGRIQKPRAWVMKTVHNKICRYWRETHRQPEQAIPRLELEALPLATESFGAYTDSARPYLEGFLARLAPREREVILLRAQGLKYREIASQLGISSNSVGTLLLRGMRKMRAARAESILSSVRKGAPSA